MSAVPPTDPIRRGLMLVFDSVALLIVTGFAIIAGMLIALIVGTLFSPDYWALGAALVVVGLVGAVIQMVFHGLLAGLDRLVGRPFGRLIDRMDAAVAARPATVRVQRLGRWLALTGFLFGLIGNPLIGKIRLAFDI